MPVRIVSGWKAYVLAVAAGGLLVAAAVGAWNWHGAARYRAGYQAAEQAMAAQLAIANLASATRLAALEVTHREIERLEREKDDALRAAVDAGRVRLRVNATCPQAADARVGDGARPELAAAARPDYHALRTGLIQMRADLDLCRAAVRELTEPGGG